MGDCKILSSIKAELETSGVLRLEITGHASGVLPLIAGITRGIAQQYKQDGFSKDVALELMSDSVRTGVNMAFGEDDCEG